MAAKLCFQTLGPQGVGSGRGTGGMFTSFVGQFPLCEPSLLPEGCHGPEQQEHVLGSGSHRGESKRCSGSDPAPLLSPWIPEAFEGLLKHNSLAQQLANWQVQGPSEDPHFLPSWEISEHFVSPQKVGHLEQSLFDRPPLPVLFPGALV